VNKVERARCVLLLAAMSLIWPVAAETRNGFDLTDSLIPAHKIHGGGPPRDGIPALTDPAHDDVKVADDWLDDDDRVMGVIIGEDAVAYPVRVLNWHEVVNDVVGGQAIAVTYCPLCGTGVVFDASYEGRRLKFGVSGLLYNSDVLLFDRETDSLVSQLKMKGVSGPLRGVELAPIRATTTSWAAWKKRHPRTGVLSWATGYFRDYDTDPYRLYSKTRKLMFPVKGVNRSRAHKAWAWLVLLDGKEMIVAEKLLTESREPATGAWSAPEGVVLRYDAGARELTVAAETAPGAVVVSGYWFALTAFYPDAMLLKKGDLKALTD